MYYCFDCGRFMCPDCYNAHEMLSESFEVTAVKEFKTEDYEALLKQQPFCSEQFHEKKITRFFCFSCQACVCQICIVTDHRNHEIVLLDKAAHDEKLNIMSGAEMINERVNELIEVIRQFEETASKLENNVATAKREVSQAAGHMIEVIREREREAIISLETTRVTRLERINSAIQQAQSLLKQMKQAVEFAKNLTERSSSSDIMRNKESLKQRFEVLRETEIPKHDETSFVKFTAASVKTVKDLKLGFIETIPKALDANRSTLEGLKQTLQAGVEAVFTLCPKSSDGEIINQPDLESQVEVLFEPAEDATNVIVKEEEDGDLLLKFTPKVPGDYSIVVKINGDKLSTCPFTVHVKERELVVVGKLNLKFFPGDMPQKLYRTAVNTEGKIVVTDFDGNCVYVFDKDGNCLRKLGGKGANSGQFNMPSGVSFVNDKEILIAEELNHRIQHINIQTGTVMKSFGKCGFGKGEFKNAVDVCLDDEGRIVVTEGCGHRIQVLSKDGETISIFGNSYPEKLSFPMSCFPYKNKFLLTDMGNHCLKVFDQSGTFLYKFGKRGNNNGQLSWPLHMHLDSSNNVLVCDTKNNRIQQFSLDGRFTGKTITDLPSPTGIAMAPDGRILVASAKTVYILK